MRALKAGASGYILKKTTPQKLIEAIHELRDGGAPMSSSIARKVVAAFQSPVAEEAAVPGKDTVDVLSNRESEILEYLAKDYYIKKLLRNYLSIKLCVNMCIIFMRNYMCIIK